MACENPTPNADDHDVDGDGDVYVNDNDDDGDSDVWLHPLFWPWRWLCPHVATGPRMSAAGAMERDVSCAQEAAGTGKTTATTTAKPWAEKQFERIECDAIDRIAVHTRIDRPTAGGIG